LPKNPISTISIIGTVAALAACLTAANALFIIDLTDKKEKPKPKG